MFSQRYQQQKKAHKKKNNANIELEGKEDIRVCVCVSIWRDNLCYKLCLIHMRVHLCYLCYILCIITRI